ncbi:MAG: type II secretion system protein [Bacilli bacterium]|nr:type II secretion system protein [Bacilli bacterium]
MRKQRLNQRGFTLIELLAVISILAILMLLATSSVTSIIASSSKKAFVIDAQNVVENAKIAYTDSLLNGSTTGTHFCMPLDYLKGKYVDKIGEAYTGSVEINISGGIATYTIWLSNGKFQVEGAEYSKIEAQTVDFATNASTTCDGNGTIVKK